MFTRPIKQMGVGVVVVMAVSLLTLLFSFLGTISSGAVLGMMLGAMRQSLGQAVFISLVFPLVSLSFSHFSKADLAFDKSLVLSALCFAVFWASYWLTRGLAYFEQSAVQEPTVAVSSPNAIGKARPLAQNENPEHQDLQGVWRLQTRVGNGEREGKFIEVQRDRLSVTLLDCDGAVRTIHSGWVNVQRLGPYRIATIMEVPPDAQLTSPALSRRTWLFRVTGETLSIACNFEETATESEPGLESYTKTQPPGTISHPGFSHQT